MGRRGCKGTTAFAARPFPPRPAHGLSDSCDGHGTADDLRGLTIMKTIDTARHPGLPLTHTIQEDAS